MRPTSLPCRPALVTQLMATKLHTPTNRSLALPAPVSVCSLLFLVSYTPALMYHLVKEPFPYDPQQPYGAPLPSTFSAPTTLLVPDLNNTTQPLLGLPDFTLDSTIPFFPPTPQSMSHLSAGGPPMNGQDIASGIPSLYQASAPLTSPLQIPAQTYQPQFSEFDVIMAKARHWMEQNPGQKVKRDMLEGAFRQVRKHSWECLGCGETRKRSDQIAHHIRGTHLDNRGFYHCDEPGWYAILLCPHKLSTSL